MNGTVRWNSPYEETSTGSLGMTTTRVAVAIRSVTGEVLVDDPRYVTVETEHGRTLIPHGQVIEIFEHSGDWDPLTTLFGGQS